MKSVEFLSFDSDSELAETAAKRWLSELVNEPKRQTYCVAFSGGRIARQFFRSVATAFSQAPEVLSTVHIFWADERCVSPEDPDSNYGLAREHLFVSRPIPPDHLHPIQGTLTPMTAAAEAEAEVRRIASINSTGLPVFDLVFLGMGEDGHIASIFPDAPDEAKEGEAIYYPVTSPKPPPLRITLSLPVLVAARQAWVMVSGPGKEEALRSSLSPTGKTPLRLLIQRRSKTIIFSSLKGVAKGSGHNDQA